MLDFDIIDAHHHFWNARPQEAEDESLAFIGDQSAILGDYLPQQLRAEASPLHLIGSVHVEAGPPSYLDEAIWLEGLHDADGLPTAIVAGASLLKADAASLLERLSDLSAVRGVRDTLCWDPDPRYTFTDRPDIIDNPTWLDNLRRLPSLGLSFDLQVYPRQLSQAASLAQTNPGVSFVLVHAGMPRDNSRETFQIWRAGIHELAAESNTTAKISGLGMMDHHWTTESLRPYVHELVAAFGPKRIMFGSNFPVDRLYSTYATLYDTYDSLTSEFNRNEREAMFRTTAVDVYRLDGLLAQASPSRNIAHEQRGRLTPGYIAPTI